MITLHPVAITDLNLRYARQMDENNIKQYIVPGVMYVAKKMTGENVEDIVKSYISKEENIPVDQISIVPQEQVPAGFFEDGAPSLRPINVSNIVLGGHKDIANSLNKAVARSMVHQTNHYEKRTDRYKDILSYYANKVIRLVNKMNYIIHGADFRQYNPLIKQFDYLKVSRYERVLNLVRFLSVAFEARDTEAALKSLRSDLQILQDNGLIIGNLAMPSMLRLADLDGVGKYYVLFCFPIIDEKGLQKITGKDPLEFNNFGVTDEKLPLRKYLGLKSESQEGGTNWINGVGPEAYFKTEYVNIYFDGKEDDRRKEVIEKYQESIATVNAVSKEMKQNLSDIEKGPSNTQDVVLPDGTMGVAVDVTVHHKSGESINIEKSYKKNS